MKITIPNKSGDLEIRTTNSKFGSCGIVEILHLWDRERKAGCVIGCWNVKISDGQKEAVFESIGDRIATTKYDDGNVLLKVLQLGQRLADLVVLAEESK